MWSTASRDNEHYQAVLQDKTLFRRVLPISEEVNQILLGIFTDKEEDCIGLKELRELIVNVKTWFATKEEIEQGCQALKDGGERTFRWIRSGAALLGRVLIS